MGVWGRRVGANLLLCNGGKHVPAGVHFLNEAVPITEVVCDPSGSGAGVGPPLSSRIIPVKE